MDAKSKKYLQEYICKILINLAFPDLTPITNTRTLKILWVILIVTFSSILCFLLLKSSVDWAGVSKMDLNKMKEEEYSKFSEEINLVFNSNRNYDD